MAHEGSASTERMKDGKRICKICGLTFPNIFAYTDHLESKEHTKGLMKNKYGPKYLEAKAQLSETMAKTGVKVANNNNPLNAAKDNTISADKNNSITVEKNGHKSKDVGYYKKGNNLEKKNIRKEGTAGATNDTILSTTEDDRESTGSDLSDDDAEVYVCQECKKICTGIISYQLHLSGKKHLKNVKKNKIVKQMQKEKILPEPNVKDDDMILDFNDVSNTSTGILCKVCNKTCTGPQSFKQHNESEGHRKKLAAQRIVEEIADQGPNIEETVSDEDHELPVYARCESCGKSFSGPIPYRQHMKSTAHFKQTRHLKHMAKFKDLVISSDDHNKIQCKECNKYFSGPLPYQEHMKSTVHEKMREKNDLIKSLQDKHKDMVIRPNLTQIDSEDSEDSDDGIILECTTCHTAFSGPESARDHFQSQKHKKIAKEKRRFAKQKLLRNAKKSKTESKNIKENLLSDKDDDDDNDSVQSFEIIG